MTDIIVNESLLAWIIPVGTFIVGIVLTALTNRGKVKSAISSVRQFIDNVDDAIYDDTIDEPEFRKIWDSGLKIVRTIR